MAGLRTEFDFTLPKGYVGDDGILHRVGTMRLATARDEIEPLRDRSIDGPDDPYLTILVLARVISKLGTLQEIGVEEVEGLFAADLAFLQDLYGIINFGDQDDVEALQASVLPADRGLDTVDTGDTGDSGDSSDSGDSAGDGDSGDDTGPMDTVDQPAADGADERPRAARRSGRIEEVARTGSA